MSASRSSPTIHVSSGSASSASSAAPKKAGLGLPSTVASIPAAYSRPATKAPESSSGPRDVCHHAVLVQAVELGAGLELGERAGEVHVAEDAVRLVGLVGASEQDRVRLLADELDAFELRPDRGHRQREHALPGERARRGARRRLELLVVELDAERAQVVGQVGTRAAWCCW